LAQQAEDFGWPLIRSLSILYPRDKDALTQDYQFMLGDRILSAPVITEKEGGARDDISKGVTSWKVYLPEGNWYHYWTNKKYSGNGYIDVPAPPGFLPMFIQEGKIIPTYSKELDTFVEGVEDPIIRDFEYVDDTIEIEVLDKDLRIDVYRSGGSGGQSVNTTDSAVRLTHMPSGIVIAMHDERSQLKNKDKAFKILRAKLYDMEVQKRHDAIASTRKGLVGTGDRSERIRTYNFPQGRISDHRINLTLYKIDAMMDGDIQDLLNALSAEHQAELLASLGDI
jgi:alpha-glucosidase (family GH31 glycosyl hydrolase)